MRIDCFYGGTIGPGAITGGDRHGLEIWSAWSARNDCSLRVHTSYWGEKLIESFGYSLQTRVFERTSSTIGTSRLSYLMRCFRACRSALTVAHADVIYSASPYFYDLLAAALAKYRNRGSTLTVALFHLIPPPWKRSGHPLINLLAWVEQRTMVAFARTVADHVVVDNAELVEDLSGLGIPSSRIVLSPMGVRDTGIARRPVDESFDAVFVGRLAGPKGVPGLISAWRRVVDALPSAKLALVGNNEVGFDAAALIERLGLSENIRVLSGLSDAEVRGVLASSRVFVTGSLEEGYGLSVLEALAAKLPCVTFDLPAFREAFPVGRFVAEPFGDYKALGNALIEILKNDSMRKQLINDITSHMKVGTWQEIADSLWSSCVSNDELKAAS